MENKLIIIQKIIQQVEIKYISFEKFLYKSNLIKND